MQRNSGEELGATGVVHAKPHNRHDGKLREATEEEEVRKPYAVGEPGPDHAADGRAAGMGADQRTNVSGRPRLQVGRQVG